jgi:glutamate-1-semialdehyde 2,1-aminomutase
VATTAGLTTLRLADEAVYRRLDEAARTIGELATKALTAEGVPHLLQYAGNLFSVFFVDPGGGGVRDFDGAKAADVARYRAFFHAMLGHGVYLPPSAFEAWFVSAAHGEDTIDRLAAALPAAARAAAEVKESA